MDHGPPNQFHRVRTDGTCGSQIDAGLLRGLAMVEGGYLRLPAIQCFAAPAATPPSLDVARRRISRAFAILRTLSALSLRIEGGR
jgi:hypothetical protein